MAEYFPGDAYDTPDIVKRALRDILMFRSRWSVYTFFFKIIFAYRPLAKKGLYDDDTWALSSKRIINYTESCGGKFHISGLDKLRALKGPVVFASNHMSTLETVILPGIIAPMMPVTYVAKESLVKGFIWGPIMRSRDPVVVNRKDPRHDLDAVLTGGTERLKAGRSLIIFPQGTRTPIFTRAGFNSLAIKLASKAGVPVVPVAVKTDFWGNGKLLRGFGPVHRELPIYVEFGDPIEVQGRGKAEHEKVLGFIESRLKKWGARIGESAEPIS